MSTETFTTPLPSTNESLAYKHFTEFLNALDSAHTQISVSPMNQIYSAFVDTPTRRRNLILSKRNEALDRLSKLSKGGATSILHDETGVALDAKFVAFVVDLLCEQISGSNGRDGDGQNYEPVERLDCIIHLFSNVSEDSSGLQHLWKKKMELALILPEEFTYEHLCQLPSMILQNMNKTHGHTNQIVAKRRKVHASSNRTKVQKMYATLGYLVTHLLVHEAEGVVQFSLLKEHLTEQIIKSGLVETRLHSLDYDAFMAGFVACCLDLMEVSTCLIENLLDENDNELDTDGGHSRECIVKEDLTVEGLDVCAIIDCFSGNTVLTTFYEVMQSQCKREFVTSIAKTLLYYTGVHITDESTSSMHYLQLVEFFHIATSPETAETYMSKMNGNDDHNNNSRQSFGSKRKLEITPTSYMTIEPILVELQTLLSIPHLRSAIRLVQTLDEQPNISPQDKSQGWCQLLDYFHQKGMLLDETKNSKFHAITVGSKTGLDSILDFFQGIVRLVMDAVGKAIEERSTAITVEEENWIRYNQIQVRKTVLKFCMRRAAFSSDLGSGALRVACNVSGLQFEEEDYLEGTGNQGALSKCMDNILMAEIEVPPVPLCLGGPVDEVDDGHLIEQDADASNNNITEEYDEEEVQHLAFVPDSGKDRQGLDEVVPPSPANVPFVVEDAEDVGEELDVQETENEDDHEEIVVESDEMEGENDDDAIVLEDSDDQYVDDQAIEDENEGQFSSDYDEEIDEDQGDATNSEIYSEEYDNSDEEFVEGQDVIEVAPDYDNSDEEIVDGQDVIEVAPDYDNSDEEIVDGQDAIEVAPDYDNSDEDIVDGQDVIEMAPDCDNSDEEFVEGQDVIEVDSEYDNSDEEFVDGQDVIEVAPDYDNSDEEIVEGQDVIEVAPDYDNSDEEIVDRQDIIEVDSEYDNSDEEIVEGQDVIEVDSEYDNSDEEIVDGQDVIEVAPDYDNSDEEIVEGQDIIEVAADYDNSDEDFVEGQDAIEVAADYDNSDEEIAEGQDVIEVAPNYDNSDEEIVEGQDIIEVAPDYDNRDDEDFVEDHDVVNEKDHRDGDNEEDQDIHEVAHEYGGSEEEFVEARNGNEVAPDYDNSDKEPFEDQKVFHEAAPEQDNSDEEIVEDQDVFREVVPGFDNSDNDVEVVESQDIVNEVAPDYDNSDEEFGEDQDAINESAPEHDNSEEEVVEDQDIQVVPMYDNSDNDVGVVESQDVVNEVVPDRGNSNEEFDKNQDAIDEAAPENGNSDEEFAEDRDVNEDDREHGNDEEVFAADQDANEAAYVNSNGDDQVADNEILEIGSYEPASDAQESDGSSEYYDSTAYYEMEKSGQHDRSSAADNAPEGILNSDEECFVRGNGVPDERMNSDHETFVEDHLYASGSGGEVENPDGQVQRGVIQIESSGEDDSHSEHSGSNKSSDDMADVDDTVDDGNEAADRKHYSRDNGCEFVVPANRSFSPQVLPPSRTSPKSIPTQGFHSNDAAIESENYDAEASGADAQDEISMDGTDNIESPVTRENTSQEVKSAAINFDADRTLTTQEVDDGNDVDIKSAVETEDERQGKKSTIIPYTKKQTLASRGEDNGNDVDINNIVEAEYERQNIKEVDLKSIAEQPHLRLSKTTVFDPLKDSDDAREEECPDNNENNDQDELGMVTMKDVYNPDSRRVGLEHDNIAVEDGVNPVPDGATFGDNVSVPTGDIAPNNPLHDKVAIGQGMNVGANEKVLNQDGSSGSDADIESSFESKNERNSASEANLHSTLKKDHAIERKSSSDVLEVGASLHHETSDHLTKSQSNREQQECYLVGNSEKIYEAPMDVDPPEDDGANSIGTVNMEVSVPADEEPIVQSCAAEKLTLVVSGEEADVATEPESYLKATITVNSNTKEVIQGASSHPEASSDIPTVPEKVANDQDANLQSLDVGATCPIRNEEMKSNMEQEDTLVDQVSTTANLSENKHATASEESNYDAKSKDDAGIECASGPGDNASQAPVTKEDVKEDSHPNSLSGAESNYAEIEHERDDLQVNEDKVHDALPSMREAVDNQESDKEEDEEGAKIAASSDDANPDFDTNAIATSNLEDPAVEENILDTASESDKPSSQEVGDLEPTEAVVMKNVDFSELTYRELQAVCKEQGLSAKGSTEQLLQRLIEAVNATKSSNDQDEETAPAAKPVIDKEEEQDNENTSDEYSQFTVIELRESCTRIGLPKGGNKEELRQRLLESKEAASKSHAETEEKDEHDANEQDDDKKVDDDSVGDDLSRASYRDLQKMCMDRGMKAGGKRDVLLNLLKESSDEAIQEEPSDDEIETEAMVLQEQALVTTTTTDTDGEVVVLLESTLMTTPQKSSSPFPRKKVTRFVSLQESPATVDQQRDEDGRVMYPSEIFHGVTMDLGQGCKGVEETDVTVRVMNKLKAGMLSKDRVKYSFGKKRGAPVNTCSKVEETSSCIAPLSSSSLLNRSRKPLDAGTVISVEEGISADPVSTSTSVASTSIWDITSTMIPGEWKCDSCSIRNGKEATECVACAHRPSDGLEGEGENAVAAPAAAAASIPKFSIGVLDKKKKDKRFSTGGFTFVAPTKADNNDPTPDRYDFSPAFTFGAAQKSGEKMEGFTFAAPKMDDDDPTPVHCEHPPAFTFGAGKSAGFTSRSIPNFSVGKPATGGFTFAAPTKADNDDPAPVHCEFPPASTFGAGQKANEMKEDKPAPDTLGFCFGEKQKMDDEKDNKPVPTTDGGVAFRASGE